MDRKEKFDLLLQGVGKIGKGVTHMVIVSLFWRKKLNKLLRMFVFKIIHSFK